MENFNIPTDNLYKFKALSGVALMMLSVYLVFQFTVNIYTQIHDVEIELVPIEERTRIDSNFLKMAKEKLEAAAADVEKNQNSKNIKLYRQRFDEIQLHLKDTEKIRNEVSLNLAISKVKVEQIKEFKNFGLIGFVLLAIIYTYGIFLAKKNFGLWQSKVQDYLDLELKNRAKSSKFKKP